MVFSLFLKFAGAVGSNPSLWDFSRVLGGALHILGIGGAVPPNSALSLASDADPTHVPVQDDPQEAFQPT